ncbi:MAG: DUF4834 family protein [Prevotella sp.]|jgi:hypothetical protein|nr:DUF4834 family protein [Prevotella sp.]MBP5355318.1 DUF4834 family protein [Prevotella sp.]MBR5391837.1 DUF4834 family protein [Prevotella sp.]
MFIIKFLLIILLAGLFLFVFLLLGVVGVLNRIRKQFTGKKEQQPPFNKTTRDGQVITDTRDSQTVNRKIFADDEGEYVEYEED